MRYLLRFVLLIVAFALTTWGLLTWAERDFGLAGFLTRWELPPIYVLVAGLAMIPPTLWDIFLLDSRSND